MRLPLPAALVCAALLVACESQPKLPSNVGCSDRRCTTPQMLAPDAPPVIQGMVFPHGLEPSVASPNGPDRFDGTIYTSSNVASVELRTNLFSLSATKKDVGRFAVAVDVYDLPSIFLRPYALRIIARNTRGDQSEEDLPFRIRGSR